MAWILFVIAGAFFTRRRPWLTGFHIGSLVWGILVEIGPWPCPLTLAENFFKTRSGDAPIVHSFLVYYLDRIVYPNLPVELIVMSGVAVCVINLTVYAHRLRRWTQANQPM